MSDINITSLSLTPHLCQALPRFSLNTMTVCAFQQPSSFIGKPPNFPRICPHQPVQPLQMLTHIPHAGVTAPKGFKAAGHTAGFKPSGLPDLAVVMSKNGTPSTAGAVFTKNIVRAAPVDLSEANMRASSGKISAVIVNSGQANAGTGVEGYQDAIDTAEAVASALGCNTSNVFVCSTGVIGYRYDMDRMHAAVPNIISAATDTIDAGTDAAKAIMTTDLKLKQVAFQDDINGKTVTVGGMCKGSGMIHPEMATMLGVLTCDAQVEQTVWQTMLQRAIDKSFNMITVDGDTSTNDVVCALCSGVSTLSVTDLESAEAQQLEALLTKTCTHLAKSVARDGEGATVLIEVRVSGTETDADARNIARTIASSSLTKAAVFGRDPNWGRIAAAAGRARAKFDPSNLKITLGDHVLMENGNPLSFDSTAASDYMKQKSQASEDQYLTDHDTVVIDVSVGAGRGSGIAWGCDLSYDYVKINAEYTT